MTNEKILQRIDRQDQRELDKEMKILVREKKIYKEKLLKELNLSIADSYQYSIKELLDKITRKEINLFFLRK